MRTERISTLEQQAAEIVAELRDTKAPVLITEKGVPSAVLVDVDSYETMQRRMQILEGIARGEQAILDGRTRSHSEAKARMAKWLG